MTAPTLSCPNCGSDAIDAVAGTAFHCRQCQKYFEVGMSELADLQTKNVHKFTPPRNVEDPSDSPALFIIICAFMAILLTALFTWLFGFYIFWIAVALAIIGLLITIVVLLASKK